MGTLTEANVAKAWEKLSKETYNNTINDCLALRNEMQLCDWAYLRLLDDLATSFCGKGSNEATLMMAYFYCQSGYKIRMALNGNKLEMLYASKHKIYDVCYWTIDGDCFYPYRDLKATNVKVCQAKFANEKGMSLCITTNMNFTQKMSPQRTLCSKRYSEMSFDVTVNENMMQFYNDYPTSMINDDFCTRWAIYANTPISNHTRQTLYHSIKLIYKAKMH